MALVYNPLPGDERINIFGKCLIIFTTMKKDLSILFLENGLLLRKTALTCYWFLVSMAIQIIFPHFSSL